MIVYTRIAVAWITKQARTWSLSSSSPHHRRPFSLLLPELVPLQVIRPHVPVERLPVHAHMLPTRPLPRVVPRERVGRLERGVRRAQRVHAHEVEAVREVPDGVPVRDARVLERDAHGAQAVHLVRHGDDEQAAVRAEVHVAVAHGRRPEPLVVRLGRRERVPDALFWDPLGPAAVGAGEGHAGDVVFVNEAWS